MCAALLVGECHNVLGLVLLRLSGEVASTGSDEVCIIGEERQDIDVGVIESRILAVLRKDATKSSFVLAIRT